MSNLGIIYDALLKFLRENDVDVFELFHRTLKLEKDASQNIQRVLILFRFMILNTGTTSVHSNYIPGSWRKKHFDIHGSKTE